MDTDEWVLRVGVAKQRVLRLLRARGYVLQDFEHALEKNANARDVTSHFAKLALARGCSVFEAMSGIYERSCFDGSKSRLHVVFLGLRLDAAGNAKQVPVDALRAAVTSILEKEGSEFTTALKTLFSKKILPLERKKSASISGFITAAPKSCGVASNPSLDSVHASALLILPAPLTSDAAKSVAGTRDLLSVIDYAQLTIPVDRHVDVYEHVFLHGADAQKALEYLQTEPQDMPVIKRSDAVARFFGAATGDVARIQGGITGVVNWKIVR